MIVRALLILGLSTFVAAGCTTQKQGSEGDNEIAVAGSSTVYPITNAVRKTFEKNNKDIKISLAETGTSGGFTRFLEGKTAINNASRRIKKSEQEKAAKANIEPVELKVAIDALSVVVHPDNKFCNELTIEQLKSIFMKEGRATKWSDLNKDWPNEDIVLFSPDSNSGTYDYFKERVIGKKVDDYTDFQRSSNDKVLVEGVQGNKNAICYFGYSYYANNTDKVKAVKIADGGEAFEPNEKNVLEGKYPLSRPLFIYVAKDALKRKAVRDFVNFYLSDEGLVDKVKEVKYVVLPDDQKAATRAALKKVLDEIDKAAKDKK